MVDMELWKKELDKLPHKGKSKIDWLKCIRYKIKSIYKNTEFEIEIIDYKCPYLYIKYLDKPIFKISTGNFQQYKLGKLLDIYTNKFKIEIGQIFKDNKRDLIIIDRKIKVKKDKNGWNKNRKYYKYKCNKCGFDGGEHYKKGEYYKEHWIEESDLLHGNGCACCSASPQIVVPGINDIATTNPKLASLFLNKEDTYKYTQNSDQYVNFKCPNCGNIIKNKRINKINKRRLSCPKCSDGISYPEKIMYSVLKELNINFIYQLTKKDFDWCENYRYDFYFELNDNKYIIEMDGGLGHGNIVHSKSKLTKEETKYIDILKDELADKHNIVVIRIDCNYNNDRFEYIKNSILINNRLNNIFNLSQIDWLRCEEFALSNLVKKTCEIKRDNPDMTTVEIGKIMGLHYSTITRYLKQGSKLGWCNYDPKEESFKGNSKSGKMSGKPVEIFKDGILLKPPFESATELERQSKNLFGVKLLQTGISAVCINKLKQYKGFTFKYI